MRVGDYLTCIKTGVMVDSDEVFAYTGKQYPITNVNGNRIEITSEVGSEHSWRLNDPDFYEYFTLKKHPWDGSVLKFNFVS